MSIPSSSAFVATTRANLAVAQFPLDLAPLLRQVAAAISADSGMIVLQIGQQNLGRQAAVREHQRLLAAIQQFARDAPRFVEITPPDSQRRFTTGGL